MNGTSALIKEAPTTAPSAMRGLRQKSVVYNQEEDLCQNPTIMAP